MKNANIQTPAGVNQIKTETNNIERSANILVGGFSGSFNGGHNKPIFYKRIMAGEKHYGMRLKTNIQLLTPLTPAYQKLKIVFDTYFVPDRRVWPNALEFYAQNGGTSVEKITEIPNIGGKEIPLITQEEAMEKTNMSNIIPWRNAWISSYIPRIGTMGYGLYSTGEFILPKKSVLPLRGFVAIFNDYLRNKEYDEKLKEYNTDTVSNEEWESYLPNLNNNQWVRAKRADSYYTDFRTELQGFEMPYPPENMSADSAGINWLNYEQKIAQSRREALDAQKNPWSVVAEQFGTKPLTEGLVQHIGRSVHNLNYSAITQNTYNNNENIQERFRVMGQQGAYSYTELDINLYQPTEFIESGYIHIIATVQADTRFEKGWDRLELNVGALEQYKPDLKDDKNDVIYEIEFGKDDWNKDHLTDIYGFKRKYTEYFKMQNIVFGDLYTENYYKAHRNYQDMQDTKYIGTINQSVTKSTYAFNESSAEWVIENNSLFAGKDIWLDYTDMLINKNLANKDSSTEGWAMGRYADSYIDNDNQIIIVGELACIAELPIDSAIADGYLKWGEH